MGGTYVTRNLMTAKGSPRDRTNNVVIVIMELQPRTFLADEDDFALRLSHPIQNLSHSSYYAPMYWLAATQPNAPQHWLEGVQEFKDKFIQEKLEIYDKLTKHPEAQKRVQEILGEVWLAGLTRNTAHICQITKDYELFRCYTEVFPQADYRLWTEEQKAQFDEQVASIWPTVSEGEAQYRTAIDKLTRALKSTARPGKSDAYNPTARVMEPIGYSGSNRITGVVEILPTEKNGAGESETPMIIHYGTIPDDFFEQWNRRYGSEIELRKSAA